MYLCCRRIPWLEYINRLLAPHVTIGLEEVAIVSVPKYISDLEVCVLFILYLKFQGYPYFFLYLRLWCV